jgi:hypothetical protein
LQYRHRCGLSSYIEKMLAIPPKLILHTLDLLDVSCNKAKSRRISESCSAEKGFSGV